MKVRVLISNGQTGFRPVGTDYMLLKDIDEQFIKLGYVKKAVADKPKPKPKPKKKGGKSA